MTETKHTPGQLEAGKNGLIRGGPLVELKRGKVKRQLAMVCCLDGGDDEQEANTQRLVAYWNACEGIADPWSFVMTALTLAANVRAGVVRGDGSERDLAVRWAEFVEQQVGIKGGDA